jgi:hypothetical protein
MPDGPNCVESEWEARLIAKHWHENKRVRYHAIDSQASATNAGLSSEEECEDFMFVAKEHIFQAFATCQGPSH